MSAKSKIIAFEANPYNYAKMRDNQHLAKLNIDVRNQLVSTSKNKGVFYISTGSKSDDISSNRGMSSSLMPVDSESVAEKIEVDTTRLDEVITKEIKLSDFVALWIDVEGAGYEVLSSIINAKQQIAFIHIEVELKEFWVGQKLKHDVIRLGEELGLVLLANSKHETQQDLILINSRMFAEHFWTVKLAMFLTKWIGPASSRMLEIFKHT